jgi:hypothetical protein
MKIRKIVLAAVFAVNAAAQEPRPASIEGIVVKLGSGEPLEGATVQLSFRPSANRCAKSAVLHRLGRTRICGSRRPDELGSLFFKM